MPIRYMMDINAKYGKSRDFIFPLIEGSEPFSSTGKSTSMTKTLFYKSSVGGGTWTSLAPSGTITEIGSSGIYVLNLSISEMSPSDSDYNMMILELNQGANGSSGGVTQINIDLSPVTADLKQIDGELTNGNNATLYLKQLNITNNSGTALIAHSTASGHGAEIRSDTLDGMKIKGETSGINLESNSTAFKIKSLLNNGHGVSIIAHGSGNGFNASGGSISGHGCNFNGNGTGNALNLKAWGTGNGTQIEGAKGVIITGLTSFGTEIISNASHGLYIHSNNVNGYGAFISGRNGIYFESFLGHGIYSEVKTGDGHAFYSKANGLGNGINSEGNIGLRSQGAVEGVLMSGTLGLKIQGTSNYGLEIQSSSNTGVYIKGGANYGAQIDGQINGIYINGIAGNAIWARSTGNNGIGFLSTGHGTAPGIKAEKGVSGTKDIDADEFDYIKGKVDDIEIDTQSMEAKIDIIDTNVDTVNSTTQDSNSKITAIQPTINDTNSKVTNIESTVNNIEVDTQSIESKVDDIKLDTSDIKSVTNNTFNTLEDVETLVEGIKIVTEDTETKVTSMQSVTNDTNSKVTGLDVTVDDTNSRVSSMQPILNTVNAVTQDTRNTVVNINNSTLAILNNMLQLTTQIDGVDLSEVMELLLAMSNGRYKHNVPSQGLTTFYKRDNITPKFVIQATEFERARV